MSKFYIKTYGCASNQADSNIMQSILLNNGFHESDLDNADFIIVNSCTVKGPTVNKINDFIRDLSLAKHKIIISGCLPSDKTFLRSYRAYSLLNPYNVDKIVELIKKVEETSSPVHYLDFKKLNKAEYDLKQRGIQIVQPLIGCLGNCTYCKTKIAKPIFYSYPLKSIISKIEILIDSGTKEIWISSEDNGAYGKDIELSYIDLLQAIEKKFQGKAMFRFGMINPWHLKEYLHETIEFFKSTKTFFKFLHIPIQSASTSVLKEMNRKYTIQDLNEIFDEIKTNFEPEDLTISTDIIVGFPNETKEDFQLSLDFISKYNFLVLNVSQFWPMSYTKAASGKQIASQIRKQRSRELTNIQLGIVEAVLTKYKGTEQEVFFDKIDEQGNFLGRTKNYISVISKSKKQELFKWKKVKIKEVEYFHLLA
jgi:threonylcarbamoyladenosine tRNA methylthiotransferase CDKAL1